MERALVWAAVAIPMTAACFWRPRGMRVVIGVFFAIMGLGVHGAFIATNPESYLGFVGQAPFPLYARLAVAVVRGLTPVGFGVAMLLFEVALAVSMLGSGRRVRIALVLGAVFLVGISPLGIDVLPNAFLAVGLWRLSREQYPLTAFAEVRRDYGAWRAKRAEGAQRSSGG